MSALYWTLLVLAVLVAAGFAGAWLRTRRSLREHKGKVTGAPIPTRQISDLDPLFALTPYGPSRETEVVHIAGIQVAHGISDVESWLLCNLAKRSRRIFEFGTATGKTAYLMARNAPKGAEVVTITLHPDEAARMAREQGDDAEYAKAAVEESRFAEFLYCGSAQEKRITQLFGDSKTFDESPYAGTMDLIFVDGAHTESYVRSDSDKALKMLAPGGWLVWHDYRGARKIPGVWRALNTLAERLPLVRVHGTSFVVYRAPAQ